MQRVWRALIILMAVVGMVFGGYFLWDRLTQVSATDLAQVIARDGVPFEGQDIPDEVIDRLAANRVVLVGEFHFLREHRELVASLLRDLHGRGFRQYLFEWTQAADWLLADYVNDGGLEPGWTPPHDIGGEALTAIRNFNRTLPEDQRIQVHAIDIHLQDYGGTAGWVYILGLVANHLPDPGPIAPFLQGDHGTYDAHLAQLQTLQAQLHDSQTELTAAWGQGWYDTVVEMVEVERKAAQVREIRDSDYDESVRQREEVIKWLADRRISASPGGTLINFGNTHAQKSGLWGTKGVEWLGDYLVHKSPAANGAVFNLWVAPAHIVAAPGSGIADFDLSVSSPANELLHVTSQTWPDRAVFLPLDDPLFGNGRVALNVAGDVHVGAPQQQYDAVLLLPNAQRDFEGD